MPPPAAADDLFRAEVRAFLAQHLSDELRQASRRNAAIFAERDVGQRWMRILAARGWSVPHWPVAWGGTGWTPQQHDIFASALAAADAPVLAPQGPKMVAPVLRPDDTQAAMQHSLQRWLAGQAPFERRAGLLASPSAIEPLWHGLHHDLGLLGAGLPEAVGGLGGGLADQALILQALGQALLPEPYTAVVVLAGGLLQRLPGPVSAGLLAGLLGGAARPVLAALEPGARHHLGQVQARLSGAPGAPGMSGALRLSGRKTGVRAAAQATHWLVTARDAGGHLCLALVMPDAPGVQRRDLPLADGSWASELAFDDTPVVALLGEPGADLVPALQRASDDTLLATGAEALGVMQRLMRETLDHVRQRR